MIALSLWVRVTFMYILMSFFHQMSCPLSCPSLPFFFSFLNLVHVHWLILLLLILLAPGNSFYIMDTNLFYHLYSLWGRHDSKARFCIREPTLTGILAKLTHTWCSNPLPRCSCPKFMAFLYERVRHSVLEVLIILLISAYVSIPPLGGVSDTPWLFNSLDEQMKG